jgi:hypothetical protein
MFLQLDIGKHSEISCRIYVASVFYYLFILILLLLFELKMGFYQVAVGIYSSGILYGT